MVKTIIGWGAGTIASRALKTRNFSELVSFVVDNDENKSGKYIGSVEIKHSSEIIDWDKYFIIIFMENTENVCQQLENYGLVSGRDFVSYKSYIQNDIPMSRVQNVIANLTIKDKKKNFEIKVRNYTEYMKCIENVKYVFEFENALKNIYEQNFGKLGIYNAYCEICGSERDMEISFLNGDEAELVWRETVKCPICQCNSRMRFIVDYVKRQNIKKDIYICEYVTNTFKGLKKFIPDLIGSEYLGENFESGRHYNGIMHQDIMNMSFASNSLECIISCDVLEHVSNYRKALSESYRCLKTGGRLIFSIPIDIKKLHSEVRATMENGELDYILPPVYHGNPISNEGSLVFTDFGWDIIEELKKIGYKDAYAVVYFSVEKGYLGNCPIIFEAVK